MNTATKTTTTTYRIFLSNFGWFAGAETHTLEDAKAEVRRLGFESLIYENGEPIMAWTVFGGFRTLR